MAINLNKLIREWLALLMSLCTPTSTENAVAKVGLYAEQLKDMPAAVFSDENCSLAAKEFEYFPSYKKLREWLEERPERAKPKAAALPGAEDPTLTVEDRFLLEIFFADRTLNFPEMEHIAIENRQKFRLSVLWTHCRRVYDYLLRTDPEVQRVEGGGPSTALVTTASPWWDDRMDHPWPPASADS